MAGAWTAVRPSAVRRRATSRVAGPSTVTAGSAVFANTDSSLVFQVGANEGQTVKIGIRDVGESTAIALATHFGRLEPLQSASLEDIQQVRDVGPVVAEHVRDFFDEPRNRKVIEQLRRHGVRWPDAEPARPAGEGPLSGETVVITGTLATMTRDEARDAARAAGAAVTDSVSKKTTLLVVGAEAGSKLRKAQDLGVAIIDEDEFRRRLAGRTERAAP